VNRERTRDRDALLLAARKLGRIVLCARQADAPSALPRCGACARQRRSRGSGSGTSTLSKRLRSGIRLKLWKMKPSFSLRRRERSFVVHAAHVDIVEPVFAAGELLEQARDVEEGRLARTRRAGDGDELALADRDREIAQRMRFESGACGRPSEDVSSRA